MWQARAVCAKLSTRDSDRVMFPKDGDYTAGKALCEQCPVRQECLTYAIDERITDGLWGGHTPDERKPLMPTERHGTTWRWSQGCRCDECVEAKRAYSRASNRRWRAGQTETMGAAQ